MNSEIKSILSWYEGGNPSLPPDHYCPTRDVFQSRLESLYRRLVKSGEDVKATALIISCLGEIGNNAFDHNLGQWQDLPGLAFFHDDQRRVVVIADRGQGVRQSLSRSGIQRANESEYLKTAFNEVVSGRSPERRGNGLKLVKSVVSTQNWKLLCCNNGACFQIGRDSSAPEFIEVRKKSNQGVICLLDWGKQ